MSGYRELMQATVSAHKNFKDEWHRWRSGKLKKKEKSKGISEPEFVTEARNDFFQKLGVLYGTKISPLEKRFDENPESAITEIIEFLSVDIPAFRCGYKKEFFLQKLKNVSLSASEKEELQRIALNFCETTNVRREFRRWCRLMVKIADAEFVLKLEKNLNSENNFARLKSRWMLEAIWKERKSLRKHK